MQKLFLSAIFILAGSWSLPSSAQTPQPPASTQQTPPAKSQQAPAAKPSQAPASKIPRAPGAKAATPFALKTPKDKASYALGMNFGSSLRKQSVDIDPAVVARGLRDA